MGSRDRLPVLAQGPREGSGLVSVIQLAQRSFGLLVTAGPVVGAWVSLWL